MDRYDYQKDSMIKQLDKIENKDLLEYIYLDNIQDEDINLENYFNESFLITRNNNDELIMLNDNTNINDNTTLSYIPKVDLLIINNQEKLPDPLLEKMINEHTIILKIFDTIYYLEDQFKNEKNITTKHETLKIIGNGIYTKVIQDNAEVL